MRIRKRFLPSLTAGTRPPSSDPHGGDHHHPPLLVQQQLHPNGNLRVLHDGTHSQPSDPLPNHCHRRLPPPSSVNTAQIGLQPSTWVASGAGSEPKERVILPQKELEGERKREIIKIDKTNDTGRKASILCAEAGSNGSIISPPAAAPPTTAHLVLEGWIEGDRLIPIKKRRGSLGKRSNNHLEEDHEMIDATTQKVSATSVKKKKNLKRGNVIMEGSRCSRVNGRGWRCCQQTLVGYSLCEHHLGKGRLRSMTSVRRRAQKVAPKEHVLDDDDDDDDDEEFKDWEEETMSMVGTKKISKKKKKKLGMVKARSLSSLLRQTGS